MIPGFIRSSSQRSNFQRFTQWTLKLWSQMPWIGILAPALTNSVILDNLGVIDVNGHDLDLFRSSISENSTECPYIFLFFIKFFLLQARHKESNIEQTTFSAPKDLTGHKIECLSDAAAFSTKLKNTLIQYHSIEDDKWRVAKKTKDVTVWRKSSEEFSGYLYKAQGVIDDIVNNIIDHIRPGPCRMDWDSLMTSLDILEHFEENCCVVRYTTAGQLWNIISPREFVDFSYTVGYKEGLLSCGISLDWSEKRSEFVRGYNHPCGWFCVPLKDNRNQSLLTGYIQTDLRGMIPQSAVDSAVASTLTNFYGDLRKALQTTRANLQHTAP
ncbi:stAR-related lipid transfer protein 4 [Orycteropus afer afer]|uniref:StAR-related lipid transfer protein 4 n=1 Tax=Orycteropus afer afer TaxID=1230840 RepID=A0A8B7AE89_ORYAF|nr:stAR-related lipid transfer protein 4 [Orycteropus afer afer]